MPYAVTPAFVLGFTPVKEQDKLVHLLTRDKGILKAIAPGALKFRNRFGSMLELFTENEFVYYWLEDKELVTLSRGEIIQSYFHLLSRPENIFYFYLVAEILLKFIPFAHPDQRLYRLVDSILKGRLTGIDMDLLLLYFLVWVLKIEGLMFGVEACQNCRQTGLKDAWIRTDFRGILCPQCHTDEPFMLDADDLQFLRWSQKHAPKDLPLSPGKIDRARLIRIFKKKIEFHGEFSLQCAQYLPQFR